MKNKDEKVVPLFKRIKIKSTEKLIKEVEQTIKDYKNRSRKKM